MKRLLFTGIVSLAAAMAAGNPAVREIKAVYLLPMTSGLDQFLASRLTSQGIVQVVTDPLKADAVLTDRVGEGFEKKLADLYKPKPEPAAAPVKTEKEKEKDKAAAAANLEATGSETKPAVETAQSVRIGSGSWSRGKGNVFLVERSTGNILWSTHAEPKNTSSAEVNKLAGKIARRLREDRVDPSAKK